MDIVSVEHCHSRQTPFLVLSVPSDVRDHPAMLILNTSAGNHGLRSVEVIACAPDVSVLLICKDISPKDLGPIIIVHYNHDELNTQHVFLIRKIGTGKLRLPQMPLSTSARKETKRRPRRSMFRYVLLYFVKHSSSFPLNKPATST